MSRSRLGPASASSSSASASGGASRPASCGRRSLGVAIIGADLGSTRRLGKAGGRGLNLVVQAAPGTPSLRSYPLAFHGHRALSRQRYDPCLSALARERPLLAGRT